MRKVLLMVVMLMGVFAANAQLGHEQHKSGVAPTSTLKRCYTMEDLEYKLKHDPLYIKAAAEAQKQWEARKYDAPGYMSRTQSCVTLNDTVVIPLVIHVVGPASIQTTVSQAVIQSQVDVLNQDFQGAAANFAITPSHFQPIFGTSKFKFVLAKRNQFDEPFDGVIRVVSNVSFSAATADNAKRSATGGSDAINPNNFLNIWVTTLTGGLLGISVFPGDPKPLPLHGFLADYRVFGKGFPHLYADYNGGRTTTHELGHFFNLFHTWGDDVSGAYGCPTPACASSDFRANPFRPGLITGTDDTPNQCGATSTVPNTTGVITDPCSPAAPGLNYQNYMDYTVDRGLTMYTRGQQGRMLGCFASNDRGPLLCSNGDEAPVERNNDILLRTVINPDSLTSYCGTIAPSIVVRNSAKNPITSFRVTVIQNGATVGTQTFNTTIAPYTETTVNLAPLPAGGAGSNQVTIYLDALNGSAVDENRGNDTAKTFYNLLSPVPGPITQGFESAQFPPTGWRVINPNAGSITWVKTPSTTVAYTGTGSTFINFYNYTNVGHLDYLVAPPINTTNADSVFVGFWRAHRTYSTNAADHDTLMLMISTDCGTTFPITAWKKGGNDLATVAGVTGNVNWAPANQSQWAFEKIDIRPFLGNATNITVAFVSKNSFGNNVFLDDINISNFFLPARDPALTRIIDPFERLCSRILTPSVEFRNQGKDTLRSLRVTYTINGGTPVTATWTGALPYNAVGRFTFPSSVTVAGPGTFQVTLSDPNGLNDLNPANNSGSVAFTIIEPTSTPIFQGFEDAVFPPTNWGVNRSNSTLSWNRTTAARKDGVASTVFRNRRLNSIGAKDDLVSPIIQPTAGSDSVFLKFDVSHTTNTYPGSTAQSLDTLEVLLTTDCGRTFTSVYKKWGAELQTVNNPNFGQGVTDTVGFIPTTTDQWRTDSINISAAALSAPSFVLYFRNSNANGNNTYIDNINVTSKIVPEKLKTNGYMIAPNPFNDVFFVRHYQAPVTLRSIQVINSAGQTVVEKRYKGDAITQIPIEMSPFPAGIYIVKLIYNEGTRTERVIKGR